MEEEKRNKGRGEEVVGLGNVCFIGFVGQCLGSIYVCDVDEICVTSEGWTGVSDHIYSNKGNGDDVYLILNIDVDRFVGKVEFVDGQPVPVGTVSFVFETSCTKQCTFLFMRVRCSFSFMNMNVNDCSVQSDKGHSVGT